MYSGIAFTKISGSVLGVHQKVNRHAHKELAKLVSAKNFPKSRSINAFEGRNGPDGVKVKSPAIDEPWHYYNPSNPNDRQLIVLIEDHYESLVEELRAKNLDKAAFEAAWLSHALIDGLTPAHHHPYEQELEAITGQKKESRVNYKKKLIARGDTSRETLSKNWMLWGAKGLFTTHFLFEIGTAMILAPNKMKAGVLSKQELAEARKTGLADVFVKTAQQIDKEAMYDYFYENGWTLKLSSWIRNDLAPEMLKITTLAWYLALTEAGMANKPQRK